LWEKFLSEASDFQDGKGKAQQLIFKAFKEVLLSQPWLVRRRSLRMQDNRGGPY
jgi:hypothetical protein